MKKISAGLVCMVALLSAVPAFASNKIGFAVDQDFGVTLQISNLEELTGNDTVSNDHLNLFLGNDGFSVDYIFKQGSFSDEIPFNWYVGGGAYYNWAGHDNIGARVPLGVTLPFAKKWDFYGQLSPVLDADLDDDHLRLELDVALGIRYEF